MGSSAEEIVLASCAFRPPGRIPRFDSFWEFPEHWRQRLGDPAGLTDIAIWVGLEGTFPTRRRLIKEEGGYRYSVDEWGRTIRTRRRAYFCEVLEVPLAEGADLDAVRFDAPDLDLRFVPGANSLAEAEEALRRDKERFCVFGKTGGPFLRSTFVRGETQFLIDMAEDPSRARAIADKVADHLLAVGLEEIRRWSLQETGIWIYDDMAYTQGPMFSPDSFAEVLLPAYRRMIRGYKEAGLRYVFLHSDGNIGPILAMLVEAGIDGINPLERRAGMNMVGVRKEFPRLILTGGMDNTDTLIHGPVEKIVAETREIIELGREGGVIIGTHSISPEIPLEHFIAYHQACCRYGVYNNHSCEDKG